MARHTQSYTNTMVFAIAAGLVSVVLLLALLYVPAVGATLGYMLVTIEVGLLLVIALAVYRIVSSERAMQSAAGNAHRNALLAKSCPDYYTMSHAASGVQECKNLFVGTTESGGRYAMAFVPSDTWRKSSTSSGGAFVGNPADHVINMQRFESMRVGDACQYVHGRPPASDDQTSVPNNYTIPWTDLRSKCDGLSYTQQ